MPIPFRARARTIDHLGREQIADCPTAISELWKNAFDAYAGQVALHIFDGEVPVAAIVDDGHGMDLHEFVEKWLVIGTDSKVAPVEVPEADRNGLPLRLRQGRKGIGRLSVGHLGSVCAIISKRRGKRFVASLIDWRLFENPYLVLEDVLVPVEEFDATDSVREVVARLFDDLVDNVWVRAETSERAKRVGAAWKRWDEQCVEQVSPSVRIAETALKGVLETRHLEVFRALAGEWDSGTAIYVLDPNHELAVWADDTVPDEDDEVSETKGQLKQTLACFVDPYSPDAPAFAYSVVRHVRGREMVVVSDREVFGRDDLLALEHWVEGSFDETGTFAGMVRAFGRPPFRFRLAPQRLPSKAGTGYLGPFRLCIGTYEVKPELSTHPADFHQALNDRADRFAGLAVYRSGLRVLPFGRPEADYFGLEVRRGKHLGREFWSHRRSFGRVAISHEENPLLRDKAGREGLIDNRALREWRILVVGVLKETARRFFGSDAELRRKLLPEVQSRNKNEQAAKAAVLQAKRVFRSALGKQDRLLDEALSTVESLARELEIALAADHLPDAKVASMDTKLEEASLLRATLRLPRKPARLGNTEPAYRRYRDRYTELSDRVVALSTRWLEWVEKHRPRPAGELARKAMDNHRQYLSKAVGAYERRIGGMLDAERTRMAAQAEADRGRYFELAAAVVGDIEAGRVTLGRGLALLEAFRDETDEELRVSYDGYIDSLDHLRRGADLSGAAVWSEEQREEAERKMGEVYSLAQLGITVEIIGHELNELDADVERNLRRLPGTVQQLPAVRAAQHAHRALMERLRYLAPLRLAGPRLRERITGVALRDYVSDFFRDRFVRRSVSFDATPEFLDIVVSEYPPRVYPVFVNLVNNSLYWLNFVEQRRIVLDRVEDNIVVADSGPGVDPDDVPHLFGLFFSRRTDGRGLGLYLSRANLHAGGHDIEYVTDGPRKVLSGANFAIRFQGIEHV